MVSRWSHRAQTLKAKRTGRYFYGYIDSWELIKVLEYYQGLLMLPSVTASVCHRDSPGSVVSVRCWEEGMQKPFVSIPRRSAQL